ncbi:MAG: Omp28-related outer membrane protein [Saprospiraceae bacterium]
MKRNIFTLLALLFTVTLFAQTNLEVPTTQKSLVTKHTATWCPFCGSPESWDLQNFFADSLDGKNAVVLSAHQSSSSSLYSVAGRDLLAKFPGVVYQPEFFFNTTKITGEESAIKTTIVNQVNQAAGQAAAVQTGLKATYVLSNDSLVVSTKTKFFQAAQGEYRLAILLVEKEVMATQAARTGMQRHKRVVRRTITANVDGVVLADGNIAANTELERNFSIKWNNQYNLDNIELVTIIWKRNTTNNRLEFVNTNEVTQVQQATTSTKNVDFLTGRFVITPNPVREKAQIRLDLPQSYNNADITLLDIQGKVIKTIYRGALNAGEQTIDIQRNTVSNGLYFVRLRADGQMSTRKVLFQ